MSNNTVSAGALTGPASLALVEHLADSEVIFPSQASGRALRVEAEGSERFFRHDVEHVLKPRIEAMYMSNEAGQAAFEVALGFMQALEAQLMLDPLFERQLERFAKKPDPSRFAAQILSFFDDEDVFVFLNHPLLTPVFVLDLVEMAAKKRYFTLLKSHEVWPIVNGINERLGLDEYVVRSF